MTELLEWCNKYGKMYWEYVDETEGSEIWDYLAEVWKVMCAAIERGLDQEGVLPGPLHLRRKASNYFIRAEGYKDVLRTRGLIFAYSLAVSEENASGGTIVTAPTCGSCGVLPGVLYHLKKVYDYSDKRIIRSLATAGLVGNVVKHNASISGAEVGCQVQIPCIERNAYAAARALDANIYASYTDGLHRVSFDHVVKVMKETGKDLPSLYKETGEGGLAKELGEL